MVEIKILHDRDNNITGYTIKGHAGAGEYGKDIVCSAVSAVAYMGIGALLNIAGGCEYIAKDGDMKCFIKENISKEDFEKAQIILQSVNIGFMQIQKSYGKYVRVLEEEV